MTIETEENQEMTDLVLDTADAGQPAYVNGKKCAIIGKFNAGVLYRNRTEKDQTQACANAALDAITQKLFT